MRLISWNIQWCRGVDGRVDPARIARVARELCDPDLCCFQEVGVNFPALAGSSGEDQPEMLQAQFPGYSAHFAWAVDVPDGSGGRRRFGNLILSRLPVQRVLRHSLPWPPEDDVPSMARMLDTWADAWRVAHPGVAHPPSFHLHDGSGEPPYCCDYVLVSADLVRRIASVRMDPETTASDHQPVIVEFSS